MELQVIGKIKVIDVTKEVGTGGFKKRDVVVTTSEDYPQDILIQFVQDKCELLDKYSVGQNVTIDYNLRGRCWTNPQGVDVYFNTVQGWKIKKDEQQDAPKAKQPAPEANTANNEETDEMPF